MFNSKYMFLSLFALYFVICDEFVAQRPVYSESSGESIDRSQGQYGGKDSFEEADDPRREAIPSYREGTQSVARFPEGEESIPRTMDSGEYALADEDDADSYELDETVSDDEQGSYGGKKGFQHQQVDDILSSFSNDTQSDEPQGSYGEAECGDYSSRWKKQVSFSPKDCVSTHVFTSEEEYAEFLQKIPPYGRSYIETVFGLDYVVGKSGYYVDKAGIAEVFIIVSNSLDIKSYIPLGQFGFAKRVKLCFEGAYDVTTAIQGFHLGSYRFEKYVTEPRREYVPTVVYWDPEYVDRRFLGIYVNALYIGGDINTTPANRLTPEEVEIRFHGLSSLNRKVRVKTIRGKRLIRNGFEQLYSVGSSAENAGEEYEPRVTTVLYNAGKRRRRVTLVCPAFTYDAGGLDLFNRDQLSQGRFAVIGAAECYAQARIMIESKADFELRVIVGAVENIISSQGLVPGDVVFSGSHSTTIENTQAAIDVVTSDLLEEANNPRMIRRSKSPNLIVDIGHFTFSTEAALGPLITGYCTNDEGIALLFQGIATLIGDDTHRFPIITRYLPEVRGRYSDYQVSRGSGATIKSMLYLSRFIEKSKWLHFDKIGSNFLGAFAGGQSLLLLLDLEYNSECRFGKCGSRQELMKQLSGRHGLHRS